jgi:sulfite reductase alpha subunit-like flavoprotein
MSTKFTPKEAEEIDGYLLSEARRRADARFYQDQIMNRRDDRSPVDTLFETLKHDQWSAAELRKRGVEAFHTCRAIGINGHGYSPSDTLLLWPTAPVAGFTTREQLQTLQGSEVELQPDGTWLVSESFFLSAHRYKPGDTLEIWPENPTRGFIKPMDALQLLKDGDIEPAELAPVTPVAA